MLTTQAHCEEVFRLYKANSPFGGQQCFADFLNQSLRAGDALVDPWSTAADKLDTLIAEALLVRSMWLYRATIDAYVNRHIIGSELVYPAYMSTASDENCSTTTLLLKLPGHTGCIATNRLPAGHTGTRHGK